MALKCGTIPVSLCLFSFFSRNNSNLKWKKCRCCAWDLNLWPQDGRGWQIHWAMTAAQLKGHVVVTSFSFFGFVKQHNISFGRFNLLGDYLLQIISGGTAHWKFGLRFWRIGCCTGRQPWPMSRIVRQLFTLNYLILFIHIPVIIVMQCDQMARLFCKNKPSKILVKGRNFPSDGLWCFLSLLLLTRQLKCLVYWYITKLFDRGP